MVHAQNPAPVVKASEISQMLNEGKGRDEIAKHYGISTARLAKLIQQHPILSKMRPSKNPVQFIDDLAPQTMTMTPIEFVRVDDMEATSELNETADIQKAMTNEA